MTFCILFNHEVLFYPKYSHALFKAVIYINIYSDLEKIYVNGNESRT